MTKELRWIFKPISAKERNGFLAVKTNAGTLFFPLNKREMVEATLDNLEEFIEVCLSVGIGLEYAGSDCPVFISMSDAYADGKGNDETYAYTAYC